MGRLNNENNLSPNLIETNTNYCNCLITNLSNYILISKVFEDKVSKFEYNLSDDQKQEFREILILADEKNLHYKNIV